MDRQEGRDGSSRRLRMPLLRPLAQPAVKPATMAPPRSAIARSAVKLHVLPPEHIQRDRARLRRHAGQLSLRPWPTRRAICALRGIARHPPPGAPFDTATAPPAQGDEAARDRWRQLTG